MALNNSLFNALKMNAVDRKLLSEVFYDSRFLFPALINSSSAKYKIEGHLFSLFPRYCLGIYSVLRLFKKRKNNQQITL